MTGPSLGQQSHPGVRVQGWWIPMASRAGVQRGLGVEGGREPDAERSCIYPCERGGLPAGRSDLKGDSACRAEEGLLEVRAKQGGQGGGSKGEMMMAGQWGWGRSRLISFRGETILEQE